MSAETHEPDQSVTDWRVAMRYLEEGNARFREGRTLARKITPEFRDIMKGGQKPFAAILTCADSRVAPEIFFDQGLGDLFVIRDAGNIADPSALGSIEFAVEHLNVSLVVVVGHKNCGAVAAAFRGAQEGGSGGGGYAGYSENLRAIMNAIHPALGGCKDADEAVRANVNYVVDKIRRNPVIVKHRRC